MDETKDSATAGTDPTRTADAGGWQPDVLGAGYQQQVLELGSDPDGEGQVAAVVVRRLHTEPVTGIVLYVHGFSDYFFQTELADFFAGRATAFYALDLRKSGRARRAGQTAHYVSDLAQYDVELDRTMDLIAAEHPGLPVTIVAHSTGGLITALYLDKRRRAGRLAPIAGLVLNSPWFDLQGKPILRSPVV
ncbi:MAG: alpha/beta hydrolase, partial [Jatrophihabitantaceae bacterium]